MIHIQFADERLPLLPPVVIHRGSGRRGAGGDADPARPQSFADILAVSTRGRNAHVLRLTHSRLATRV